MLPKTLPKVAAEMALQVLSYDMTQVMSIMGVQPLLGHKSNKAYRTREHLTEAEVTKLLRSLKQLKNNWVCQF
jgi:hypothetical protein